NPRSRSREGGWRRAGGSMSYSHAKDTKESFVAASPRLENARNRHESREWKGLPMKPTAFTTTLSRASLCLQAGYGLSLTDAAGAELTTRTGRVWLTMEGDARDVNLKAGDAYTIERNGLTLVSALEPSVVQVRMPGRSAK